MSIDINEELRDACCQGNIDHAQQLIKAGALVNSRNKVNGWTAMHWACKRNQEQVVALLLGAGANPNVLNDKGEPPITLTSSSNIRRLLQLTDEGIAFSDRARYSNAKGTTSSDGENSPGFVPSYLRYPAFPYTSKDIPTSGPGGVNSGGGAADHESKRSARRSHHGAIAPPPPPPPQRHHSHPAAVAQQHHVAAPQSVASSAAGGAAVVPRNGHEAAATVTAPGIEPQQFSSHPPQPIRIARSHLVTRSTQTAHPAGASAAGDETSLLLKVRLAECSRSDKNDADFYEVELDRSPPLSLERLLCGICRELEVQPGLVRRIRKLPDVVVRKDADARRLVDGQQLELVLL